ncbi:SpoIIE family protein phosphatase [Bacillus massilinigeriensis]|uniref:SpoIIE family protein phosphatase n=1 Tax=Bacillus mediterraneensis TaxID=1805474 RepID=UPI0008F847BB|nr:fused response regulator/phosphatase [Bacillus mediterraneensis]
MGILIVDDNKVNLFVIEKILKRAGYLDYTSFTSAIDMFEHLEREKEITADVILMDIMMPELDGIEACKKLQLNSKWKDIPVIFVTALEDSSKVAEALEVGGMDYIMKPIDKTELIARLRVALRLKAEKDWHKEQEERIRTELDLSMQVQTSLLSEPIINKDIFMKASYLPANKLAGDMYHWHRIDEHRYAAVLLDMMGHGISASLVCMYIASALRDAIRGCPAPEYVVGELNRCMNALNMRNQEIPYYFTGIYIVIDTKEKAVQYVNAGHPFGFALIDKKELVELSERTCAVGFFDQIEIHTNTIEYNDSIQLLLLTDGVEETAEKYGLNEYNCLKEAASTFWNVNRQIEPLNQLLDKSHQKDAEDDMCAVIIQAY